VIFSNIFQPILHNIRFYIYIVKYKSNIKIPGFLQNILKKNVQNFEINFPFQKQKQIFCFMRTTKS